MTETLDSVFLQSRPPDEVFVIDDGCPDVELLRRAVAPHADRIVLLHQAAQGVSAAFNTGICATRAEYVALLTTGDRWLPNFLVIHMEALRRYPAADVSFSNGIFIGQSELAGLLLMPPLADRITLEELLTFGRALPSSAVVVKRAAILEVGGFDESAADGADFDLWVRMTEYGAAIHGVPKALILRRPEAMTNGRPSLSEVETAVRALERLRDADWSLADRTIIEHRLRALRSEMATYRGKALLALGDVRAARAEFSAACAGPHDWRVRAARVALAVAPWIAHRVYASFIEHPPAA